MRKSVEYYHNIDNYYQYYYYIITYMCGTKIVIWQILHHNFTYIPPSAFKGGVWNSEHKCIDQFLPATAETSKYDFQFKSPKNGCLMIHGILHMVF